MDEVKTIMKDLYESYEDLKKSYEDTMKKLNELKLKMEERVIEEDTRIHSRGIKRRAYAIHNFSPDCGPNS